MKVRVSDLPPEGLNINDTIPLAPLNSRMAEGRYKDIEFIEDPSVALSITPTVDGGAEAKGSVRSKYRHPCGRCLDPLERTVEANFHYILSPRPEATEGESKEELAEDYSDDIGLSYYDGDQIELEDLLQESLILKITPFYSPSCKANGDCELCGFNIDKKLSESAPKTTSFGELLKKAVKDKGVH